MWHANRFKMKLLQGALYYNLLRKLFEFLAIYMFIVFHPAQSGYDLSTAFMPSDLH